MCTPPQASLLSLLPQWRCKKGGGLENQLVPCFTGHPGAAWGFSAPRFALPTLVLISSVRKKDISWGHLKAASAFPSLLASYSPPRDGLWPHAGPKSHLDSGKWELCGPPTLLKLPNKQILKAPGSLCVHSWEYFLCLKEKKADRRNCLLARTCSVALYCVHSGENQEKKIQCWRSPKTSFQ